MKIESKKNYLSEGLVHKVYKVGEKIFKVPKDEFEDFNNLEHFAIEKISHIILKANSLPAAEVTNIYEKNEIVQEKYVLEEDFVKGKVFDNPDISDQGKKEIISLMLRANEIKVQAYGRITSNGSGSVSSWKKYIKDGIEESSEILKKICKDMSATYINYLLSNNIIVPEIKQGYFLMLDTNSNNYVFNEDNKIIAMLDIDHPISGDKLYEYAALKFHHPDTFAILTRGSKKLSIDELKLLNYYFVHFGLSTLAFEVSHNLNLTNSLETLKNVQV